MDLFELGEAITKARRQRGWTQGVLAEKSALSRATVNQLENGKIADLGVRKLMGLLSILGLTLTLTAPNALPTLDDLLKERYHES